MREHFRVKKLLVRDVRDTALRDADRSSWQVDYGSN